MVKESQEVIVFVFLGEECYFSCPSRIPFCRKLVFFSVSNRRKKKRICFSIVNQIPVVTTEKRSERRTGENFQKYWFKSIRFPTAYIICVFTSFANIRHFLFKSRSSRVHENIFGGEGCCSLSKWYVLYFDFALFCFFIYCGVMNKSLWDIHGYTTYDTHHRR